MDKLDQRICIIGGGPAGTSAAMYLEKRDTKITLFTKRPTASAARRFRRS